jgi:hypothetical protein
VVRPRAHTQAATTYAEGGLVEWMPANASGRAPNAAVTRTPRIPSPQFTNTMYRWSISLACVCVCVRENVSAFVVCFVREAGEGTFRKVESRAWPLRPTESAPRPASGAPGRAGWLCGSRPSISRCLATWKPCLEMRHSPTDLQCSNQCHAGRRRRVLTQVDVSPSRGAARWLSCHLNDTDTTIYASSHRNAPPLINS